MLRTSLYFVGIAILALLLSDFSITTFDPWQELGKMATGMLTPEFTSTSGLFLALLNTLSFALLGITIAVICSSVMALYFGHVTIRLFCAFIRSVHELFWAFLLMPLTGLNATCGILGIPTLGYFIDSAISLDHLDTALLLIIISGLLNMAVDSCSQIIRKRLRISVNLVAS
jgi:ABC-type phosphate/phosphonate transport system permease subunit